MLADETGMVSDTVAKLLYEWSRPDRPPGDRWQLGPHATVVVDEAGMLGTHDLHRMMQLARQQTWRLVLVGDPHQLQAVGRGGMFAELCSASRTIELERIHRFVNQWEATASLQLRHGDTRSLDTYEAHRRIVPGSIDQHLETIATYWTECRDHGQSLAITTTRNEHVDLINDRIQSERWRRGELDRSRRADSADGIGAWVGDLIATRRNDRTLITSTGQFVRNRDQWIVTAIDGRGDITAARIDGGGVVRITSARCHVDAPSARASMTVAVVSSGVVGGRSVAAASIDRRSDAGETPTVAASTRHSARGRGWRCCNRLRRPGWTGRTRRPNHS